MWKYTEVVTRERLNDEVADGAGSVRGEGAHGAGDGEERSGAALDRLLTGTLPCIRCGYDLRGLSIRGVCPECGTPLRTTILYRVDPEADAFQPIRFRRAVAAALVIWPGASLLAIGCLWVARGGELLRALGIGVEVERTVLAWTVLASCVLSAGALAMLVRPFRTLAWWRTLCVVIGVLCYYPIAFSVLRMLEIDGVHPDPFTRYTTADRWAWRLLLGAGMVGVFLGFRPVARELVKRSLALRTGRVDRQTLLAMAAATLLGMVGDVIRLSSGSLGMMGEEAWIVLSSILILVGSGFVTIGMVACMVDGWRIGKSVLLPSPSARAVLDRE